MRYLSVVNHKKHQHYKDRRPPWIKLHAEVLDDYAFGCLQDASKAHLMLIWVLASKHDNKIPYDLVWITQQINSNAPIDVEELVLHGFISISEDDSKPLAFHKQNALPETEGETETESEKRKKRAPVGAPKGKYPSFAMSDSARFHKTCLNHGYAIELSLLRKWLSVLYPASGAIYSADEINNGIEAFLEARGGQPPDRARFWTLKQFAEDAARFVRLGKMPRSDANGVTERGRLAVGE